MRFSRNFEGHAKGRLKVAKLDLVVRLQDGRPVGYCEYGAEGGLPVIALHGTPGSRRKYGLADAEARRIGLRIISVDRWGYGLTAWPKGRFELRDYASDIEEFADALGLQKFGVVGISGGGPFAAVIAALLPERVSALALVAPVSPLSEPHERVGVSPFHRFAFRVLPRLPGAVPFVFSYFRLALFVAPPVAIRTMASRAGRTDRKVLLRKETSRDLVTTFRAGLAKGVKGAAIDMRCFSRGWNIDLSAIACPARMWIGDKDRNVPVSAAKRLASSVAQMDVIEDADAGHFWVIEHHPEVLSWLKDRMVEVAREPQKDKAPARSAQAP